MRFLIDANMPRLLTQRLLALEHDAESVVDWHPHAQDSEIEEHAGIEQRIIITQDLGFGDLNIQHVPNHPGIIMLRAKDVTTEEAANLILDAIAESGDYLSEKLTVVSRGKIRISLFHEHGT